MRVIQVYSLVNAVVPVSSATSKQIKDEITNLNRSCHYHLSLITTIGSDPIVVVLGSSSEQRQQAYLNLFDKPFANKTLAEIRYATHKGWVLGSERFKQQIAEQISRPVSPKR